MLAPLVRPFGVRPVRLQSRARQSLAGKIATCDCDRRCGAHPRNAHLIARISFRYSVRSDPSIGDVLETMRQKVIMRAASWNSSSRSIFPPR